MKKFFFVFLIVFIFCSKPNYSKLCDTKSKDFKNELLLRIFSSNRQPFCFIKFTEKISSLSVEPDTSFTQAKFLSVTNAKLLIESTKNFNLDTVIKNFSLDNFNFRVDKVNLKVSIAYPSQAHEIIIENKKITHDASISINLNIGINEIPIRVIENNAVTDYKLTLNRNPQFLYIATGDSDNNPFTYQYGSINQTTGSYTKIGQNITMTNQASCIEPGHIQHITSDYTGKYIIMICGKIGTGIPNQGNNIFSFKVEKDGKLTLVSEAQSEEQVLRNPSQVRFHPNNQFFYVGNILKNDNLTNQRIAIFSFNSSNGQFSRIGFADNCQANAVASITIDQNGKWLYSLTESASQVHTICNYEINSDGSLKTNSSQSNTPPIAGSSRLNLKTTADNSFVIAGYQSNLTEVYSINEATGVLSLVGNISTASSGSLAVPNQFPNSTRYIHFGGQNCCAATNARYIHRALLNSDGSLTFNAITDFFNDVAHSTGRLNLTYDLTDSYLYSASISPAINDDYRFTQFSVNKTSGVITPLTPAFISDTPTSSSRIYKGLYILY